MVLGVEQRAAPGGDDRVRDGARFLDRMALERPEMRLAVDGEDLDDGAPGRGLDEPVGVDERAAEPAREQPADFRLPGRHEAGQDETGHG